MKKKAFELVKKVNEELAGDITEISVKAHQISMMFAGPTVLPMVDIVKLDTIWDNLFVTDVTTFNEDMFVSYRELSATDFDGADAKVLYDIITQLREKLCSCPSLEFVISESYFKIFLDIPNVEVKNLLDVNEMFGGDGYLELNDVRPYILYINDAVEWDTQKSGD